MKLPLSLHARVGLLSILMVIAVFAANFKVITFAFEGVLADNIDIRLDTNIILLRQSVGNGGLLNVGGLRAFPDLVNLPSGWGWDVATPSGHWHRGLAPGDISYPFPRIHEDRGIYSGRGHAVSGEEVHVRRLDEASPTGTIRIIMMSPRVQIDNEIHRVGVEMYTVGAQVVALLIVISILQIRVGLYPLRKLVDDVAKVHSGTAASLPERQPSDLQPLATEINALILRNKTGLETARIHAANLAHAVATPLASLMLQLEYEEASQEAQDLLAHVSQRVAHHLHRARGAAAGADGPCHCDVNKVVEDVRATMALIHRSHPVEIATQISETCTTAVDAEDLGEMLSNLVDNACRYAKTCVSISVMTRGARLELIVEDDGDGVPEDKIFSILQPGVRLDEVSKGYGLGLAIVRELVELYGGTLKIDGSGGSGGLRAIVDLPR
ncbi:sensor histidine kinase [Novosphingobium terrae]|uniref:sensor histidine kinase n=1 Tax=Novosphingobium terrae TaxID=2726189 RepID=UPI00197CDAD3|nr:HAMP domain-containing sensor histidine kinase [Novosphingobium terrae]